MFPQLKCAKDATFIETLVEFHSRLVLRFQRIHDKYSLGNWLTEET